jgi:hypothetical protein
MLEKQITYDHSITDDGHIQVRQIIRILEDGVEISKAYHRHVVSPGEAYDNEDSRTKVLAQAIHTPAVVDAYKAQVASNELSK